MDGKDFPWAGHSKWNNSKYLCSHIKSSQCKYCKNLSQITFTERNWLQAKCNWWAKAILIFNVEFPRTQLQLGKTTQTACRVHVATSNLSSSLWEHVLKGAHFSQRVIFKNTKIICYHFLSFSEEWSTKGSAQVLCV